MTRALVKRTVAGLSTRVVLLIGCAGLSMGLSSLTGCEGGASADRTPRSQPSDSATQAVPPADPTEPLPPTSPPETATTQPAAPKTDPDDAAKPVEPDVPDYLSILERMDAGAPVDVLVVLEPPSRIRIDTTNIKRLRIDRESLPLDSNGSIALILDGVGIQWFAKSSRVEFVRTRNGGWRPAN